MRKVFGLLAVAAVVAGSTVAEAQTVAYYRFEELAAGQEFPAPSTDGGPDSGLAVDSAGGDDTLRTFAGFTNPVYHASVAGPTIGQTGQANNTSLDFNPNEDLYTAGAGPLNATVLNNFTVEAFFNVDNLTRYHGLVGKDGKPSATSLIAPLQLKVRDDSDLLQFQILDSSGVEREVLSLATIVPGQWYKAAAVSDGTNLSLYLDGGSGYVLQGTSATAGGILPSDAGWTVGRGFYNNSIADWTDGKIDEVRISGVALSPSQFLGVVPEPSSLGLLGAAALLALRRRR